MRYKVAKEIELTDGYYLDNNDPIVSQLAHVAEKHKLTQEQFADFIHVAARQLASVYRAKGDKFLGPQDAPTLKTAIISELERNSKGLASADLVEQAMAILNVRAGWSQGASA